MSISEIMSEMNCQGIKFPSQFSINDICILKPKSIKKGIMSSKDTHISDFFIQILKTFKRNVLARWNQ